MAGASNSEDFIVGQASVPAREDRLLAAAIGGLVSAAAALTGAVTIILGIIGVVGIPVGVVIGYWLAPRLLLQRSTAPIVVLASVVALPLGIGLFGFVSALAESAGATPLDIVSMTLLDSFIYGIYGSILGWPMALVVGAVAARLFRRLAPRSKELFRPAVVVVGTVVFAVVATFAVVLINPGDAAARRGDTVGFEYRVDNLSSQDYSLDVRSYWKGQSYGGQSGYVGQGACAALGNANDALQSSDWALFLSAPNSDWEDRPAGTPIVTNREYNRTGTVRLTIVIGVDGTTQINPGIAPGCAAI